MFKQQHVSTGKVGTDGVGSPLAGGGVVDATAPGQACKVRQPIALLSLHRLVLECGKFLLLCEGGTLLNKSICALPHKIMQGEGAMLLDGDFLRPFVGLGRGGFVEHPRLAG